MPSSVLDEVSAVRWEPVLSAQLRSWGMRENHKSGRTLAFLGALTSLGVWFTYYLVQHKKINGSSALPLLSTIIF